MCKSCSNSMSCGASRRITLQNGETDTTTYSQSDPSPRDAAGPRAGGVYWKWELAAQKMVVRAPRHIGSHPFVSALQPPPQPSLSPVWVGGIYMRERAPRVCCRPAIKTQGVEPHPCRRRPRDHR